MKTLEAVAVVIEVGEGKYIAQRPREKDFGNLWEFPGGTLEEGETREQCAYRKIEEKFPDINISTLRPLGENVYYDDANDRRVKLFGYHATHISGEFEPTEHQDVAIVSPHEFNDSEFAPADGPFFRELRELQKS